MLSLATSSLTEEECVRVVQRSVRFCQSTSRSMTMLDHRIPDLDGLEVRLAKQMQPDLVDVIVTY